MADNLKKAMNLMEATQRCTLHADDDFYTLIDQKGNVLLTGNKEVKTLFKSLQKQQHTMKKWITHLIERVYVIEDLIAEHLRRNKSHDVCMHIGCNSKPSTDKAYCRKHLHGKGNRFKNL